jgi:hypothetical protein
MLKNKHLNSGVLQIAALIEVSRVIFRTAIKCVNAVMARLEHSASRSHPGKIKPFTGLPRASRSQ